MILAKVVGNVVSTIKPMSHNGYKLMIVEMLDLEGKPYGSRQVAIDAADAGIGDTVLIIDDGGAALMILNDQDVIADWVICGVIDYCS